MLENVRPGDIGPDDFDPDYYINAVDPTKDLRWEDTIEPETYDGGTEKWRMVYNVKTDCAVGWVAEPGWTVQNPTDWLATIGPDSEGRPNIQHCQTKEEAFHWIALHYREMQNEALDPNNPDPEDFDAQGYIDRLGDEWSRPIDDFTRGYIECLLWSTTDDNDKPLDDNYSYGDISPAFMLRIKADCYRFQQDNAADLDQAVSPRPSEWSAMSQAGHDFWLTRNGHGAGFWDASNGVPYPDDVAERLTNAAHKFGNVDVYTIMPEHGTDQEDMEIHAMQESASDDFDPERYIDQLTPGEVAKARDEEELHKRGFQYREYDGAPPTHARHWLLLHRNGTANWVFKNVFFGDWQVFHYTPADCFNYRGTFDEMLAKFDKLHRNVGEAIDPNNPEAALDDMQPPLVKGELIQDVAGNEIWYADRTSDEQHVGTIYCDQNHYGYWGWNEFYPEYFGREPKDFQQHNHETAASALAAGAHWLQQKGTLRPGGPSAAIESINEDENDDPLDGIDPQDYIDWVGQKMDLGELKDLNFGFTIGTTNDYTLQDNAAEHGINLEDPAIKDMLTHDFRQLEINTLRILRKWFLVNDEGHDGYSGDELICSAWITHDPNPIVYREAVKLLKDFADNDEPVSTSKGDFEGYFGQGSYAALYNGVSNYGQSLIDVYVDMIDRDKVVEWFEVNPLAESVKRARVFEDEVDLDHYLNKLTPSYCRNCMADLTQPNSVQRRYEESEPDPAAAEIKTVDILGHYDQYHHFDPDEYKPGAFVDDFTYRTFTYHDDSDTCVACGSTNLIEALEPAPEDEVNRYLDSFENLPDFQYDLTNYGFGQCNRIEVWGRWVILAGTTYWAEIEGRPTTQADFERLCAEFCKKHHVYGYHLKLTADDTAPAFGNPSRWFWFQLAVPKAVFADESCMALARASSASRYERSPELPYLNFPHLTGPMPPEIAAYQHPLGEALDLDDPDAFMAHHTTDFNNTMVEAGYIPTRTPEGLSIYAKPFVTGDLRVFVTARLNRDDYIVFSAAYGHTLGEGSDAKSIPQDADVKSIWLHIALAEIEQAAREEWDDNPKEYAKGIVARIFCKVLDLEAEDAERSMDRLPEALTPDELDDPESVIEQDYTRSLEQFGFEFVNPNNAKMHIGVPDQWGQVAMVWATLYTAWAAMARIEFKVQWGEPGHYQQSLNYYVRVKGRWLNIVLGHVAPILPDLNKLDPANAAQKFITELGNIVKWLNVNNPNKTTESVDDIDDPESILAYDALDVLRKAGYEPTNNHEWELRKTWTVDLGGGAVALDFMEYRPPLIAVYVFWGTQDEDTGISGEFMMSTDWMNIIVPAVNKFMDKRMGEPEAIGKELFAFVSRFNQDLNTQRLMGEAQGPDDFDMERWIQREIKPKWRCPACKSVYNRRAMRHLCIGGFRSNWRPEKLKGKFWTPVYEGLEDNPEGELERLTTAPNLRELITRLGYTDSQSYHLNSVRRDNYLDRQDNLPEHAYKWFVPKLVGIDIKFEPGVVGFRFYDPTPNRDRDAGLWLGYRQNDMDYDLYFKAKDAHQVATVITRMDHDIQAMVNSGKTDIDSIRAVLKPICNSAHQHFIDTFSLLQRDQQI